MTQRELTMRVDSPTELSDLINEVFVAQKRATVRNVSGYEVMIYLDTGLTQAGIEHSVPVDNDLGLRADQTWPLFNAAGELLKNVVPGMIGRKHPKSDYVDLKEHDFRSDHPVYESLGNAFSWARENKIPPVEARIAYDDVTRRGELSVSHPIVSTSPDFNLQQALEAREVEGEIDGLRETSVGGLGMIDKVVKNSLMLADVEVGPIQTVDDLEKRTRRVWFGFQRK